MLLSIIEHLGPLGNGKPKTAPRARLLFRPPDAGQGISRTVLCFAAAKMAAKCPPESTKCRLCFFRVSATLIVVLILALCSVISARHFFRARPAGAVSIQIAGPLLARKDLLLKQHRLIAALLAAFFVLSLTSCGSGSNSFTWFVDAIPSNLDPQVASAPADVIACENLYSGLVRRTPEGELAPDLCQRWEVSADKRTYTFYLKDGLTYTAARGNATDYAITAEDFVFAFRRMFLPGTNSPYAVEFSALENSAGVLAGQQPASALGVSAADPLTLVFRLSVPDETFLSKLTLPGAMPCDEEFFDSTRGTYGLTSASTLSSGPFYLYNWTSSGLFLRRESSGDQIDNLRLVENTNNSGQSAEELIRNDKCSAALDDTGTATSLQSVTYSDTTWALLFNCDSVFRSTELRQALGSTAAAAAEVPSGGLFAPAKGLVPDGLTVDGIDYRQAAGDVMPAFGDPRSLYISARDSDGFSPSDLGHISLLLPAGSGLSDTAEQINSAWQKEFSLFFSVEEADPEEFSKRLASGDYTIALAPIQAEGGSVYAFLEQFSPAGGGLTGYSNALYTTQLDASATATGSARCSLLAQCERQLLDDAVAVPLFTQQKRLLVANGIKGLVFDPFGPVLDVTFATKN